MVASIGAIASASQGVSYYEQDGYYANDDPAHKEASAWNGKGAGALGISPARLEPELFKEILEGHDAGRQPAPAGRREAKDGIAPAPPRTGHHVFCPEIGLSGGADRWRPARSWRPTTGPSSARSPGWKRTSWKPG